MWLRNKIAPLVSHQLLSELTLLNVTHRYHLQRRFVKGFNPQNHLERVQHLRHIKQ